MSVLIVGSATYPDITSALADAIGGDTLKLKAGYSDDAAVITVQNLSVSGVATSTNIDLTLGTGIGDITLLGAAAINVFDNAGANVITGNNGTNTIEVTGGADVAHGGGGEDRLIVDYRTATATVIATTVSVTDGGIHSVTYDGFEDLALWTGSGNDTVTTGDADSKVRTFAGNDTITIGDGRSAVSAGSGNDTVTTGDGGDTVNGGRGDDIITTGAGRDVVDAASGNDTVSTQGGSDRVMVKSGIDSVDEGTGNDRLVVDYSHALTNVSGGISSGSHSAGYSGLVTDVTGNSVAFQNAENFTITTGRGDDQITSGGGQDILDGGNGKDALNAGAGNDQLSGGLGADTLTGGLGADVMSGGGGADTFLFGELNDSRPAAMDLITDLQLTDTIDVSAIDADTGLAGNQAFHLVSAFSGHAGEATFAFDSGGNQTVLSLDANGDGAADFRLAVSGDHSDYAGFVL